MIGKDNIKKLIISGRKDDAVKKLRALKGLSKQEAQQYIDTIERRLVASGDLTLETSGKGLWGWLASHL